MTSQQSVNTKIIARLRHVLGHCRENDAFTRKVIVDFIVVDLAFCKHIKILPQGQGEQFSLSIDAVGVCADGIFAH